MVKHRRKSRMCALCLLCWYATQTKAPAVTTGPPERCSDCGRTTRDGLYVERDPVTVAFPRYEEG